MSSLSARSVSYRSSAPTHTLRNTRRLIPTLHRCRKRIVRPSRKVYLSQRLQHAHTASNRSLVSLTHLLLFGGASPTALAPSLIRSGQPCLRKLLSLPPECRRRDDVGERLSRPLLRRSSPLIKFAQIGQTNLQRRGLMPPAGQLQQPRSTRLHI